MRRFRSRALGQGLAVLCLPLSPLAAQNGFRPAASVVASTLGFGAEFSLDSRRVGVRAGYYLFTPGFDRTVEGVRYQVNPELRNARAALDLYPFAGRLRLSAGLVLNNSGATGVALLAEPLQIGDRTYQPSEVGQVLGRLAWDRRIAPFAGMGLVTGGRLGLVLDLGLAFSGRPLFDLEGVTNLTGAEREEFEANVLKEEAEVNQAIADEGLTRFYPMLSFGLRLRF